MVMMLLLTETLMTGYNFIIQNESVTDYDIITIN
jgi:hypothetical protein